MKRLTLIGAVSALLLIPAGAEAKGIKWLEVCGQDECSMTEGEAFLRWPLIIPPALMNGGPNGPPRKPAAWYRVKAAFEGVPGNPVRSVFVPSLRYAGGRYAPHEFVWEKLEPDARRTYAKLTEGIAPRPAETMPGAVERTTEAMAKAMQNTASAAAIVLRRA